MSFQLSSKSAFKLTGVHPDLITLVEHALQLSQVDFTVLCGRRTVDEQKAMVAAGKSQTMRSRHLTGHAVDLGALKPDGTVTWDFAEYEKINQAMQLASQKTGIPVEWGGDWKTIKDGDHWQLPWKEYP